MSLRSILLGFAGGLAISGLTYFNDRIMVQTRLIGSAFPISVFGAMALILLLVNPALRGLGRRGPLSAAEVATAAAIALAACAFPGQAFFEYFTAAVGLPAHMQQSRPAWQSARVMSYVPDGSPALAVGHVQDWPALIDAVDARRGDAGPVGGLYDLADQAGRHRWDRAIASGGVLTPGEKTALVNAINAVLADPRYRRGGRAQADARQRVAAGRAALVDALPGVILPPPRGWGVLLNHGEPDEQIIAPLVLGQNSGEWFPVDHVRWRAWGQVALPWVLGTLALALASLALAVVVHPQWSQRELLAFPIPRFFELISRREPGRALPDVARCRLFWFGLGALVLLHAVNGLHAWFPVLPEISRSLDFSPLRQLFPAASRTPLSYALFRPTFYPSAVAFAFFVSRNVSLSLGLAPFAFAGLGAVLLSRGVGIEYDRYNPSDMNFLRLGAYLAVLAVILYSGRRYYLSVLAAGVGRTRSVEVTPAAVWAARMVPPLAIAGGSLFYLGGFSPLMAAMSVGILLLVWFIDARIVSETGMYLIAGPFALLGLIPSLVGEAQVGPTQFFLLGILGFIVLGDVKEALMPMVVNGLEMVRRGGGRPTRIAPLLAVMTIVGCGVAFVATVTLHHEHGIQPGPNTSAVIYGAARSFDQTARYTTELASVGLLAASTAMDDVDRVTGLEPDATHVSWLIGGVAVTLGVGLLRLRVPWWPIHPVLFLVFGTWGISVLGMSFLLGWCLHSATVRLGGTRAYHAMSPLMVGVIAGELIAGLGWMIVGWGYWWATGLRPETYLVFAS